MTYVLLITDGLIHPPLIGRVHLHRNLGRLSGFDYQHRRTLEALPGMDLSAFAALVLYFHHRRISESALDALDRYVATGGGLLAIHSATASFKQTPHYFEILGGRFTGHGPVDHFTVEPVPDPRSPFAGVGAFTIRDELYLHDLQPGVDVKFDTDYRGSRVPVVWTYSYGEGRVCYAGPGHTGATMRQPAFGEVLRRGLTWAAGF